MLPIAPPLGFDAIPGTPRRKYALPLEDNSVPAPYKSFLEQTGSNALRAVGMFDKA
jgi:5-methyltetrahydrofolate--homocysteine methyltransferase